MSELLLEKHRLLDRVIQYWSDTNGFQDKKFLIECIRFNQITDEEINDISRKYGNFCLESELLDLDIAKKLITWISGKKNYHECWYKFELLFNLERDGLKSKTFHKNCDGKGPTIVIIKLYDGKLHGQNGNRYKKSNIKPGFEKMAIGCSTSNGLTFGITDLYIQSDSKYCKVRSSHYECLNMLDDEILRGFKDYQTKVIPVLYITKIYHFQIT
ncbi:44935_t:CDS:2 [Gigaspora margarita]|uniref:44935_t:CDS:1 n=1 Tax=Gigaspora margarita TaxID=4874 RepID=A0ABN7VC07_GIGMA|nr:44935_t:CDS:2 [Gigaspora margarita]